MSDPTEITFLCPADMPMPKKIIVVKSLRTLFGCGLKDARIMSETTVPQTQLVYINKDSQLIIDQQIDILISQGVIVADSIYEILQKLRDLGAHALLHGKDELANEILQLVIAEKLRGTS